MLPTIEAAGAASGFATHHNAYRVILVDAEASPAGDGRIKLAARLAARFGAELAGRAAAGLRTFYPAEDAGLSLAELVATDRADAEEDLAAAASSFKRIAESEGVSSRWSSGIGNPSDIFVDAALSADLIIVGSPAAGTDGFRRPDVGDLLMRSGRPVIVVPEEVDRLRTGDVVVAWKNTRETRRAVADAMGFLRLAETVRICAVVEGRIEETERELKELQDYLRRHEVSASMHIAHGDAPTEILALASGADLLVAGAYGRSRLREWAFGGVTRSLLYEAPCCVFFSR